MHDMLRSTLSTTHPLTVRAVTSCCPGHNDNDVIEALRDLELAGQAEKSPRAGGHKHRRNYENFELVSDRLPPALRESHLHPLLKPH